MIPTRQTVVRPQVALVAVLGMTAVLAAAPAAAQEAPEPRVPAAPDRVELPPSTLLPLREVRAADRASAADRTDAIINGALILAGAAGVIDNVVFHWILGWHRLIEDHPHTLELEIAVVAVSAAMLATGIVRERRARRTAEDR